MLWCSTILRQGAKVWEVPFSESVKSEEDNADKTNWPRWRPSPWPCKYLWALWGLPYSCPSVWGTSAAGQGVCVCVGGSGSQNPKVRVLPPASRGSPIQSQVLPTFSTILLLPFWKSQVLHPWLSTAFWRGFRLLESTSRLVKLHRFN